MVSVRSGMIIVCLAIGSVAFFPSLPDLSILCFFLLPVIAGLCFKRLRWLLAFLTPLLFGLVWGTGYGYLGKQHQLPVSLEGLDVWLEGEVVGLPKQSSRSQRFEVRVLTLEQANGTTIEHSLQRVRINWYQDRFKEKSNREPSQIPELKPGQRWRLLVRLKRPHGFANAGGFDYEGWLFQQGIGATGYVRQHADNRRLAAAATGQLLSQWRYALYTRLSALLKDDPQRGLLIALLMGERADISASQWQLLSATGTNHLFVISGLHIGFIALCAYLLFFNLSRLLLLGPPRIAAQQIGVCGALLTACGYAAIAGFSLPTQRALIMLIVMLLGRLLRRKVDVWHSYVVALLLVLLLDPLAPQSMGFWLSFGAVGSLLYAFSQRTDSSGIWWRWLRPQWVVFVAFFPVVLFFFQLVSLISPLANTVAIPFVGFVIVPICLLTVLLDGLFQLLDLRVIELLMTQLAMLASDGLQLIVKLLAFLAQVPGAQWRHPLSLWALLPALAGIALLMAPKGLPARWLGLLCFLPLVAGSNDRLSSGQFEMTVLDVGQGLAVAIRTRQHHLIYDVGARFSPTFDVSSSVILPYLQYQGVASLDRVIISHGDNDHAGSLPMLLAEMPVAEVISGASKPLLKDIAIKPCLSGQEWQWDEVHFELMQADEVSWKNENNRSCVLKVSGRNLSVLIPGDIERTAESYLIEQFGGQLKADILLAPHHGSLTSSGERFLAQVNPSVVVVSSGYRNRFGHPHAKVLVRYRQRNIKVLNTAKDGAIVVTNSDSQTMPVIESHRQIFKRYWF